MAQDLPLTDLPVGSTFKLTARVAADDGDSITVELLQPDGSIHGQMTVTKATGVMAGYLTVALADTQVEPVAVALQVGDVVRHAGTGEVLVVQATGLGPDGSRWSPSTAQRPTYPGEGWAIVGHFDLP